VQPLHCFLHRGEPLLRRFDDQQMFAGLFYSALPPVDRTHGRAQDIHAGGKAVFHQRAGNAGGFRRIAAGDQHNNFSLHFSDAPWVLRTATIEYRGMVGNVSPTRIKFGTSGWRAHIADEFTVGTVRRAVRAVAGHVRSKSKSPVVIVGHDTRFFSEEFARAACEVLAEEKIHVLLCGRPTPTPVIAHEILRRKTDGAINFTASHNPAEYHGLKFSGPDGGPALPEVTKDIEARAASLPEEEGHLHEHRALPEVESIDPAPHYFKRLKELVNFKAIAQGGSWFVCDAVYGCGAGYTDRALIDNSVTCDVLCPNFTSVSPC